MQEKRAHLRGRLKSKMRQGKRMEEKKMESEMSKD